MAEPWAKYATPQPESSGPWSKYAALAEPAEPAPSDESSFQAFVKGLKTFTAPFGAGSVAPSEEQQKEELRRIREHPGDWLLDQIPFFSQFQKVRQELKSGREVAPAMAELGGELIAGAASAPPVPIGKPSAPADLSARTPKSPVTAALTDPEVMRKGIQIIPKGAAVLDAYDLLREKIRANTPAQAAPVVENVITPEGPVRPPLRPVPPEVAALPAEITPAGPVRPPMAGRAATPKPVPEIPQSWIDAELPIAQEMAKVEVPAPAKLTPAEIAAQELFDAMKESGSIPETAQPGIPIDEAPPVPAAPARTLNQVNADMGRKNTPTEAPRSMYNANGELKSADTRAVEIENAHRLAKASRFAEVLKKSGLDAKAVKQIETGRVSDNQMLQGMAPRWENLADHIGESAPSAATIQEIIRQMGGATKTTTAKMMKNVATPAEVAPVASASPEIATSPVEVKALSVPAAEFEQPALMRNWVDASQRNGLLSEDGARTLEMVGRRNQFSDMEISRLIQDATGNGSKIADGKAVAESYRKLHPSDQSREALNNARFANRDDPSHILVNEVEADRMAREIKAGNSPTVQGQTVGEGQAKFTSEKLKKFHPNATQAQIDAALSGEDTLRPLTEQKFKDAIKRLGDKIAKDAPPPPKATRKTTTAKMMKALKK